MYAIHGLNLIFSDSYDFPFKRSQYSHSSGGPQGRSLSIRFTSLSLALLLALLVRAQPSWAQEEEPLISEEDEDTAPPAYEGDVIYLRSGSIMSGVQILRSTVLFYEVQLVQGVDPLLIPRKQVDRVEYDDIDPARDRIRERLQPKRDEVSLASGEQVSRGLMEKLSAPLSETPLEYVRTDLVTVLEEIAERLQVKLKIHPSIRNRQANRRMWTLNTTPETTLMSLLREDLLNQFKFAEVLFEYDTIVVLTKEASKNRKAIASENVASFADLRTAAERDLPGRSQSRRSEPRTGQHAALRCATREAPRSAADSAARGTSVAGSRENGGVV